MTESADRAARRGFWRLAAAHLAAWTLLPALCYPNAPLDAVEMYYWGHQWQWGYSKHPPLPGWLAAVVVDGGLGAPGLYLLSQLCVLACFWSAWRLGVELLGPRLALWSVVLLQGVFYFSVTSPEFNNNLGLMAFWALTVLFLWWALESRQLGWWVASGLTLGLALLCKYSAGFLALTVLGLLLFDPGARRVWRTPGPWLAGLAATALLAPHLSWAAEHDWITLTYAMRRAAGDPSPWRHLLYPLRFAAAQLPAVLPVLLLARPALGRGRVTEPFARRFLDIMVLGPLALHLLVALLAGIKLRSMWGAPLWTFTGVWLLYRYGAELSAATARRMARAAAVVAGIMLLVGARFLVSPYVQPFGERVHFPGRALAMAASEAWRREVGGELPAVGGPWWLAGNVGFYAPAQPDVYGDLDPITSSWMDDEQFRRRGGVLLWYAAPSGRSRSEQTEAAPREWLRRFPTARLQPPLRLSWQTARPLPPIVLGLAVVPPATAAAPPPPG